MHFHLETLKHTILKRVPKCFRQIEFYYRSKGSTLDNKHLMDYWDKHKVRLMIFKINSFEVDLKSSDKLRKLDYEVRNLEEELNQQYRDEGKDIEFIVGMNTEGVKAFKLIFERYVDVNEFGFVK
jgi:hypothetical protein